jgi:hypothetical protein
MAVCRQGAVMIHCKVVHVIQKSVTTNSHCCQLSLVVPNSYGVAASLSVIADAVRFVVFFRDHYHH